MWGKRKKRKETRERRKDGKERKKKIKKDYFKDSLHKAHITNAILYDHGLL